MKIIFFTTLFFLIVLILELVYSLVSKGDTRSVQRVVEQYTSILSDEDEIDILFYRKFSDIKFLDTILASIPAVSRLDELLQQGGVKVLAGVIILSTLTIGGILFHISTFMNANILLAAAISAVGMFAPYIYLLYRRKNRRSRFEELFPDALDLMGYSLKAGHSILASFKMVAEEMASPVGEEFDRVVEEINFGKDLNYALRNFSRRIDSPELKFFVTSLIIQRETGGNLVEMLGKISEVIRKKFRFREKVKTLSAEGKLSAAILLALPFLAGIALFVFNPEYIMVLMSDPIGPYVIAIALAMMSTGSFIMYRLVQLDM